MFWVDDEGRDWEGNHGEDGSARMVPLGHRDT